jgi:hypothetical protein
MTTGAATEVPLGAGALVRAGHIGGGRDDPDPVRRGRVSNIARKALDDMRLRSEHARDRCLGLGVIDVQATTMVPGLEAFPTLLAGSARRRLAAWLYVIKFLAQPLDFAL